MTRDWKGSEGSILTAGDMKEAYELQFAFFS